MYLWESSKGQYSTSNKKKKTRNTNVHRMYDVQSVDSIISTLYALI